jgi:hypothetical protein
MPGAVRPSGCGDERVSCQSRLRKGCKPNSVCPGRPGERIICLSGHTRNPAAFAALERAAPRFPIWPCTRWGFPCPVACAPGGGLLPHLFTLALPVARRGGLFSVALSVNRASRPGCPRVFHPGEGTGYAASRPAVFGLSSPSRKRERAILRPSETSGVNLIPAGQPDKHACAGLAPALESIPRKRARADPAGVVTLDPPAVGREGIRL